MRLASPSPQGGGVGKDGKGERGAEARDGIPYSSFAGGRGERDPERRHGARNGVARTESMNSASIRSSNRRVYHVQAKTRFRTFDGKKDSRRTWCVSRSYFLYGKG